jgi:hypothetical protein
MTTITFGIGTTDTDIIDLAALGVAYPLVQPDPYMEQATLGDGNRRGLGGAKITWSWGYLGDQYQQTTINIAREALRDYCAGASADVWIKTPTNENDAVVKYQGVMVWPFPETREAADTHRRIGFSLEFINCIAST